MKSMKILNNHLYSINKEGLLKAIDDIVENNKMDCIPVLLKLLYHTDTEVVESSIGALSFLSIEAGDKDRVLIINSLIHMKNSSSISIRRCIYISMSSILICPSLLVILYDSFIQEDDPLCLLYILQGIKEIIHEDPLINIPTNLSSLIGDKLVQLPLSINDELFLSILNASFSLLPFLEEALPVLLYWYNQSLPTSFELRVLAALYSISMESTYLNQFLLILNLNTPAILLGLVLLDELPYLPLSNTLISTLFSIKRRFPRLTQGVNILIEKVMLNNFSL